MGILEKISEIEKEIARTQKNKGEQSSKYMLYVLYILKFLLQCVWISISYNNLLLAARW